jgi:hypothetical protein
MVEGLTLMVPARFGFAMLVMLRPESFCHFCGVAHRSISLSREFCVDDLSALRNILQGKTQRVVGELGGGIL